MAERWEAYRLVLGVVIAAVAGVTGVIAIHGGVGSRRPARFKRYLGAAMLTWGAGQLLKCLFLGSSGDPPFPAIGDLVNLAAVPLAVAGVLAVPRAVGGTHPVLRIVLDAGLLSTATSLVVWRLLFVSVSTPALDVSRIVIALTLLLEIALCSLAVVRALCDLQPPLMGVAAGAICFMLGDVMLLHRDAAAIVPSGWVGQLLWTAAWPLAAWGAVSHPPAGRASDEPTPIEVDPDARVTVITTIIALLLLLAGVGAMIGQSSGPGSRPLIDPVSWAIVLASIVLLGIRELLNARMRTRLLGRLHEEATSDPLTGLANRRLLTARLAAVRQGEAWCLVALDLDGFKGVNELLGQSVGDRLLCAVGDRLTRNLPRSAVVARTGGDEFAVLLPGGLVDGIAAADVVLTSVRRSCWDVEGVTRLPVTASVGVTTVGRVHPLVPKSGGGGRFSDLSAAGAALQLARSSGGDRFEVFDGAAALARSRRLSVEEGLRSVIGTGGLDVRFQPVIDLRTGAVSGVEALARWTDPRLGTINPQEFIPVAEQTGLVVALGEFVLHRTLEQAMEHGLPDWGIRVACNVSPVQLRVPGFPQLVEDALDRQGMPPGLLLVEVTEAVFVDEDGPAVAALRRLADVGVTIAIDDFGTGYSALGYLRRLPAHTLKIDRSLTAALVDEAEARAITRAVIDLGANLGVSIVVEGIETSDVAELVTSMGAGYGQGSLYGSAMPMSDIVRIVRRPAVGLRPA